MRGIGWVALGLALSLAVGARAGTPFQVKETCAVGGERFTYTTTASYTIFGQRPDGRPYGSWTFPLDLPICPKNGLVMYREFTKDERARLPALLASPAFTALRPSETPYYRAAWLERALDGDPDGIAWLLLSAIWETDDTPERQARYATAFIAAADKVPPRPGDLNWLVLRLRVVNALRELGRFDEASKTLAALPRNALTAPPEPPPNPEGKSRDDEASRAHWREFGDQLAVVIARGDRAKEPLDLIPVELAAELCLGSDETPARKDALCSAPPLVEAIAQRKADRAAND